MNTTDMNTIGLDSIRIANSMFEGACRAPQLFNTMSLDNYETLLLKVGTTSPFSNDDDLTVAAKVYAFMVLGADQTFSNLAELIQSVPHLAVMNAKGELVKELADRGIEEGAFATDLHVMCKTAIVKNFGTGAEMMSVISAVMVELDKKYGGTEDPVQAPVESNPAPVEPVAPVSETAGVSPEPVESSVEEKTEVVDATEENSAQSEVAVSETVSAEVLPQEIIDAFEEAPQKVSMSRPQGGINPAKSLRGYRKGPQRRANAELS